MSYPLPKYVLTLATLGLVAGFFTGCEKQEKVVVRTVEAKKEPLVFTGVYYGEFQAAESVAIHVPDMPDTHQLTVDSVLEDGTRVKKGDVILTFVRETLELDLRDELEAIEVARAERNKVAQGLDEERINLELEVKRKQLAVDRAKLQVVEGVNLISKLELDKAKLDVEKAELELELAKKALKTFRQKRANALKVEDLKIAAAQRKVDAKKEGLELVEVRAPIDGVIYAPYTRLNWQRTKVAEGVVARPGDLILELPDFTKYHAQVYVRQRDASLISVGDKAKVRPLIMPDRVIEAKVIKKEDFATTRNERFRTETAAGNLKEYLVTLELDEAPEQLRPGNSGRVEITSVLAEEAVQLPVIYTSKQEDNSWAVTYPDGSIKRVELGKTNLTHVEILEGIDAGETVRLPESHKFDRSAKEGGDKPDKS